MKVPPQDGFMMDDGDAIRRLADQKFISTSDLLERGKFSFIEFQTWPTEYAQRYKIPMEYRRKYKDHIEKVRELDSTYSFGTDVIKVGKFGIPLYEARHRIHRLSDGALVAEITDVVFGGGLLGAYLSLFLPSEGQDSEYVSCGYASKHIGSWRPNDISNKRYSQYIDADVNFISSVLGPTP